MFTQVIRDTFKVCTTMSLEFSYMKNMKLQSKMILLILALLLFVAVVGSSFSLQLIATILEEQIGRRALKISQTISLIPEIKEDLEKGDLTHSRIQNIAEQIRTKIHAQFIVIGDSEGRRYSHPVPERLGKFMVGGDNEKALLGGMAYISKATGTMGPSIRGKAPVLSNNGEIIGIVSVGYLIENMHTIIRTYQSRIIVVFTIVILIGVVVTLKITNDLKSSILGLEPKEIASLYQERTATLETIREGIMAVDTEGLITTVNQAAFKILSLKPDSHAVGKPVKTVFPESKILDALTSGESQLDKILILGEKEIIVNRIPIFTGNKVTGVVSSFRDKNELDIVAKKLSQVKKYSEMLRIQTHEYSNKLHTISGLIQIGAYQEAIELIGSETSGYQNLINTLMSIVRDPILAGAILGKYNRAKELKIEFEIDPDSSMRDIPIHIKRDHLVTILGNIIDNSLEALLDLPREKRRVKLAMTDLGYDLIFDIDDSGPGVDSRLISKIFQKGYSSKSKRGHGMGLYLVEKRINILGGTISVGKSELGGAAFTVIIPKKAQEDKHNA